MDVLYWLAGMRTPLLDRFFLFITAFGDETLVIAAALIVLWCFPWPFGRYLLYTGLFGILLNQSLKGFFQIPRPWQVDPAFSIVEGARAGAAGYSFPSGHTSNAAVLYGCIAAHRPGLPRAASLFLIALVALSRLYLGVHTPLDVGVSLLLGGALVLLFRPLANPRFKGPELSLLIVVPLAFSLYLIFYFEGSAPSAASGEAALLRESVKNAYMLFGIAAAFALAALYRERRPFPILLGSHVRRILLCILGLALIFMLRLLLKAPLAALFWGNENMAAAARYFLMVLFGGILWPLTFPFWNRLKRN